MRPFLAMGWAFALSVPIASHAQNGKQHPSFEILTHRMDVDVDGAPNAYGPPGMQTLDILLNAHYLNRADKEIVGYLIDEHIAQLCKAQMIPSRGITFLRPPSLTLGIAMNGIHGAMSMPAISIMSFAETWPVGAV